MVRVYLTDTAHFAEFNEMYDGFFAGLRSPRRPHDRLRGAAGRAAVEIDALAVWASAHPAAPAPAVRRAPPEPGPRAPGRPASGGPEGRPCGPGASRR